MAYESTAQEAGLVPSYSSPSGDLTSLDRSRHLLFECANDLLASFVPDPAGVQDLAEDPFERANAVGVAENPRRYRQRKDSPTTVLLGFGMKTLERLPHLSFVVLDRQIVLDEKDAIRPFIRQRHGA